MPTAHPGGLSLVARGANSQTCIGFWVICPDTVRGWVFWAHSTHWDTILCDFFCVLADSCHSYHYFLSNISHPLECMKYFRRGVYEDWQNPAYGSRDRKMPAGSRDSLKQCK